MAFKICQFCKREWFSLQDWREATVFLGFQPQEDLEPVLELRNCVCGTTHAEELNEVPNVLPL